MIYVVHVSQMLLTLLSSCCISDVSCQWKGAIFDPRSSEIWGVTDRNSNFRNTSRGTPHMPNMTD